MATRVISGIHVLTGQLCVNGKCSAFEAIRCFRVDLFEYYSHSSLAF